MTTFLRVFMALALIVFGATPAQAGPLVAVIPIVIGAVVKSVVLKVLLTAALSVAVSALTKSSGKKATAPGIQTERRLSGGVNSRTIMLGLYATAGSEAAPPMSYGNVNKTPNAYLCVPIVLADFPIDGFSRLIVNGEYVDVNTSTTTEHGWPIGGKYAGKAWVRLYDGRQTAADSMLVSHFGSYIRPWDVSKIGYGVAYAVVTFLYDSTIYTSEPEVLFEVRGARLYDPRKDSTIGGVGSHRWDDQSTWEYTVNNIVMVYNVLRGIPMPDGSVYGGECTADDLPVANWVAAMNVCDESVTTSSGTEPRYRAGFEIKVAEMEPATVVEELLKGCAGEISEDGGTYKLRVGGPGLPVMFVTDADFIVSEPRDYDPHAGMNDAKNTVYGSYPSPDENWGTHDAPVQQNADFLAQDQGIELSTSVQFPTVPYPGQVQRLMLALLKDDRRWRRHSLTIGHFGFALEPLDVIAWTSTRNQYSNKLFDIASCNIDPQTLSNTLALREVDPADYNYQVSDELPDPVTPGAWDLPPVQTVPGFGVEPAAIKDDDGVSRRPALRVYWAPDAADDATFVKVQVRLAAAPNEAVTDLSAPINDGQTIVAEGILPGVAYQVRGKIIANRATAWTDWISVTAPNVKMNGSDIDGYAELQGDIAAALAAAQAAETAANAVVDQIDDIRQSVIDAGGEIDTLEQTVATQGGYITANATAISNAVGDLSELSTTVATQGTLISQVSSGLSTLDGDFATLTSTVNAQGVTVTETAQAVSTLDLRTASLENKVAAGSPNLLPNGSFENGHTGWNDIIGAWDVGNAQGAGWGNYASWRPSSGTGSGGLAGYVILESPLFDFAPGAQYSVTGDVSAWNQSGNAFSRFQVMFFSDEAGNSLITGYPEGPNGFVEGPNAVQTFFETGGGRDALTLHGTSPVNTVKGRIRLVVVGMSTSTPCAAVVRRVKFERGPFATPYTDEASVVSSFRAISTATTQLATLTDTVSTQGVTISNTTSAINTINGSVATALARVAVRLDVNGYVTGWEANNNGSTGNFVINADYFQIVKPGGGARLNYSNGLFEFYNSGNQKVMDWGIF